MHITKEEHKRRMKQGRPKGLGVDRKMNESETIHKDGVDVRDKYR